jgi:hypothetical protein
MPKVKAPKQGKFRLKYSTARGRSSEISGELGPRGESLLDMVVTALSGGASSVVGLEQVITQYDADCAKRLAECNERLETGKDSTGCDV